MRFIQSETMGNSNDGLGNAKIEQEIIKLDKKISFNSIEI
jgi:hypothetical protein